MAVFASVSAAFTMRKKLILQGLRASGALSPEKAMTLREARVENPELFPEYTEKLVAGGIIAKTREGKYYLPEGNTVRRVAMP